MTKRMFALPASYPRLGAPNAFIAFSEWKLIWSQSFKIRVCGQSVTGPKTTSYGGGSPIRPARQVVTSLQKSLVRAPSTT